MAGTLKKGLEKSNNYTYDCVLSGIGLPDGMDITYLVTKEEIADAIWGIGLKWLHR